MPGLDRIGLRLTELALVSVILVLIAALLCAAAAVASRLERRNAPVARATEVAAGLPLALFAVVSVWPPASMVEGLFLVPPLVRVVPPVIVAAAAWRLALRLLRRDPAGALAGVPDAVLWLSGAFAARLLLAAGYAGTYGAFFLPLPVLLCVVGLLAAADRAAAAIGPSLPRLTAGALALFLFSRSASVAHFYRQPGWTPVRTPVGEVRLLEPVASTTQGALDDLAARVPAGGSLSGFPEAGFFTYALDLRNPFWMEQFFPGRLDAAGEERAIALLGSRPPDALLYTNVVAVGEGQRVFGTDYLRRLDAAARSQFRAEAIYGPGARPDARIGDPDFFVEVRVPQGAKR